MFEIFSDWKVGESVAAVMVFASLMLAGWLALYVGRQLQFKWLFRLMAAFLGMVACTVAVFGLSRYQDRVLNDDYSEQLRNSGLWDSVQTTSRGVEVTLNDCVAQIRTNGTRSNSGALLGYLEGSADRGVETTPPGLHELTLRECGFGDWSP